MATQRTPTKLARGGSKLARSTATTRERPPESLGEQITRDQILHAQRYQTRTAAIESVAESLERIADALVGIAGAITHAAERGESAASVIATAIERAGDTAGEAIQHHASITATGSTDE